MKLNLNSLKDRAAWEAIDVKLPQFDIEKVTENTKKNPEWVHFGAGNIFRGFICSLQQELLNKGLAETGIIAADTFDYEIIDRIFRANDNLTVNVTLNANGTTDTEIIASVVESLKADCTDEAEMARFVEIFTNPSLKMVSYTITEKGIRNADTVESSLPYSVRSKASKLVAPIEEKMRRAAMITAKHKVNDEGCFVQLALSDGKGEIINLRFLCADEAQAQLIENNFRRDAENYYLRIAELLSEK